MPESERGLGASPNEAASDWLQLGVAAAFCALAGVYASLRLGSDTAATAAGTSIGISLVPPLCASGYGLGTGVWSVCGGAALLFLTNLVAILVVGTIAFVAAGFNRVDVTSCERAELAKARGDLITAAIARRLAGLFESSWGPGLRFVMPFVLLGLVYVPLRRALDEVVWEVGARAAVRKVLAAEQTPMVQSRVHVERHELDLNLVMLGTTVEAQHLRERLASSLRAVVSVEPHIHVIAIPDAASFAGLESSLRSSREPLPVAAPASSPSPMEQLEAVRSFVQGSVARLWPDKSAGGLLEVEVGAQAGPCWSTTTTTYASSTERCFVAEATTFEADKGASALTVLDSMTPHPCLLLLDLMMPIMSGSELLHILHERGLLASLPVIVLSAGGSPGDVPEAQKFLRKPFEPDRLLDMVRDCCG